MLGERYPLAGFRLVSMAFQIEQGFPIQAVEFVGLRKNLAYLSKLGGYAGSEISAFVVHIREMQECL
jgi:hypothetical protein